ncbi:MAG: LysR family transcriptional regulator, partial [Myxococcaceae bacterium]|nr:LysR family transcriptional regulator [Myxococcaceae bacterium]
MHPKLRELPWDDVRVFLAVARAGSLKGAAAQLAVDKATVSRRLGALERWLDGRLFLRTREGLKPSELGQRLTPHAEAMESAARGFTSTSTPGPSKPERVRIATTEALAARLVRSGLLDLCEAHPNLELDLLGGNRPVNLLRGEAELALRFSPPTQKSLRSRIVARLGFGLYASARYLTRRG